MGDQPLSWSCGSPCKPGETYLEHVRRCDGMGRLAAGDHEKCKSVGAWRETWLYVDSYIIILCECGELLDIFCEHMKGVWPNSKSVCEWVDDDHLICTRCGIDGT